MTDPTEDIPPVLTLLGHSKRLYRQILAEFPATGRRWRRPARRCPVWCAAGHHCTAQHGYPSGEHRSVTATLREPFGCVVASRVQGLAGPTQVEMTVRVSLAGEEATAVRQGVGVPMVVAEAITAYLLEEEAMNRVTARTAVTARAPLEVHSAPAR